MARYIHRNLCPDNPFISINCGAVCQTLSESEIFGHAKGAYTGADIHRIGKIELADTGILFLDEIGNMPMAIQEKLLTVIEEKEVIPIGSNIAKKVAFMILSATNKDLEKACKAGTFREDLYYRIHQYPVRLPALRDYPDAIAEFVDYYVQLFNEKYRKQFLASPKLLADYKQRRWAGNLRELKNDLQVKIALWEDPPLGPGPPYQRQETDAVSLEDEIEAMEHQKIRLALSENNANVSATARALGLRRQTLQWKIVKYGIFKYDLLKESAFLA